MGVIASWFYPKPWYIELAFWGALAISALPGVLTIPVVAYLIGFITCIVIYTLYSMIWALNHGILQDIKGYFDKLLNKKVY